MPPFGIVEVMKPIYLLDNKLKGKLHICGIPSFGDVSFLSKHMCSAISSFLPLQPKKFMSTRRLSSLYMEIRQNGDIPH